MANQHQHSDSSDFNPDDDIDKVLGRANPNPTRAGCPPREVLIALSRRERPIEDPAYEHLTKCSPCYREFRAFQDASARSRRTKRLTWVAAVAAVVLVAGAAAWFLLSAREGVSPGSESAAQRNQAVPVQRAELDLRKYVVARSEREKSEQQPVSLTRDRLSLTVLLPVGSEPGTYEVQVVDSELKSRASGSGSAEIRTFVTTLETTLDLRSVPSGPYQLALRRQGEEWQLFPARVE